jgi:site-specific DNA recombinase
LRAAIYVRVSTQQQTEKYSLDAQKRILSDYCVRNGYEYEIYEDAGISGETIEDRPAIKKLLADIPEDDYDIVLVIELERLSRSEELLDWLVIKKVLRDNFVKLATPNQMFDLEDDEDDFLTDLFGALSKREKKKIIRRMTRGKHQAMSEGRYAGGYLAYGYTYDYETKKLQIDPEQAEVIKLIYRLSIAENMSTREIAEELNARSIPTHVELTGHTYLKRNPRVKGWYSGTVRGILINSIYKGMNRYNYHEPNSGRRLPEDQWKYGICPAIVSEEIWELAQKRLRDRRIFSYKNKKYHYLLSNLLYCRECECKMQGITYKYKDKPAYAYYKCNGRTYKFLGLDCTMPSVKKKPIEALVWEKIVEIVTDPSLIRVSLTNFESDSVKQNLADIRKRLEGKELERERLISAYRKGIIEVEELEAQVGSMKSEIHALHERKSELEEMLMTSSVEERVLDTLYSQLEGIQKRIEDCSFADRQEITRLIVRRVWLDMEGNVEIEARVPLGPDFPMLFGSNSSAALCISALPI